MRARPDEWTVVLAGQWNPRLFNPEWVSRNLYARAPVMTEIATGPLLGLAGWRLILGETVVLPADDRLIIGTRSTTDRALEAMENIARRVLELLPHTPLFAVGINFGFAEEAPEPDLLALFRGPDLNPLGEHRYEVLQSELRRTLTIEGGVLNVNFINAAGAVNVSVNAHRDLADVQPEDRARQAGDGLRGRVVAAKAQALALLERVYALELAEE